VKVQFKFNQKASGAERKQVLDQVQDGEAQVEPLFPDEHDPELSSIFVADLPEEYDDFARRVLALLEESPAVEFAEPEVERKLIRPTGKNRSFSRSSRSRPRKKNA
jgi:hypothetical protein